jgi:surfeit locus 1 family protein
MQIDLKWFKLNPTLLSTMLVLVCVGTFIKLGMWQLAKGQAKQAIEVSYHHSESKQPVTLNDLQLNDSSLLNSLHASKVHIRGYYDDRYQILLDNQVHQQQAGFHVLTPFLIEGSNQAILVNRGWVVGFTNHQTLPKIDTSKNEQQISGMAWVPSNKIFSLEQAKLWQVPGVWQQLDYNRYRAQVPFKLLPIILKLDASVKQDGFVREWQLPPSKVVSHFGYAYQWFGFAIAAVLIYFYNICTFKQE